MPFVKENDSEILVRLDQGDRAESAAAVARRVDDAVGPAVKAAVAKAVKELGRNKRTDDDDTDRPGAFADNKKCFLCKQKGHIAKNCPNKPKPEPAGDDKEE